MTRPLPLAALLLALVAPQAMAADLVGPAQVKDGDSLMVDGKEVRLHGVDAPEWKQPCTLPSGEEWKPGQEASAWLASVVAGKEIACKTETRDRYGRFVATCYVDGRNLNDWLVRSGWAMAYRHYSTRYVDSENAARADGLGIWRGECLPPWDWRHRK